MKYRYSRERKRELEELAYKYRDLLEEVLKIPFHKSRRKEPKALELCGHARREIGYSEKTDVDTIIHSLWMALKRIKSLE